VALVCVLIASLHVLLQPYRLPRSNAQESVALLALVVIALLQDHTSFAARERTPTGVGVFVTLLVFAVSAGLLASWARQELCAGGSGSSGGKQQPPRTTSAAGFALLDIQRGSLSARLLDDED
jgi:hypothetical protein